MDELERFEQVCKPQLNRIEQGQRDILREMREVSILVDRHEQSLSVLRRVVWTLFAAVAPMAVGLGVAVLRWVITNG